jgi:hypothetical protein
MQGAPGLAQAPGAGQQAAPPHRPMHHLPPSVIVSPSGPVSVSQLYHKPVLIST